MNPGTLLTTVAEYGPGWAVWRAAYAAALRSGFLRRLPAGEDALASVAAKLGADDPSGDWLGELWRREGGRFFLPEASTAAALPAAWRDDLVARADRIVSGHYPFFGGERSDGPPPDWHQGVSQTEPWPRDVHWTRIGDLTTRRGDIKFVWELSRFGFAFTLGRAFLATGDERYAESFWQLTADWQQANPWQLGPQWRCGQETSLRALAWLCGLYALRDARASTPARQGRLIAHLRQHGRHIAAVNWYAVHCVKNNHAISEAVALRTLGVLLPFLPEAARWRRDGRRSLARELDWQVAADGTYVQNSNNYARLVAQLLSWDMRLEQAAGGAVPPTVADPARRLLGQLRAQLAGRGGELPNYGPNDGTLLLPWSGCAYRDFRPALHALDRVLGGEGLAAAGADAPAPWREEAFWFGADDLAPTGATPDATATPSVRVFPDGGLTVLRGDRTMALFRCGEQRHRPVEADMLHVDFWARGTNLLLDPGTCGYNLPAHLRGYFAGTAAHNTITIDGADQMRRGDRFLWHEWVHGESVPVEAGPGEVAAAGRHRAYLPFRHHRTVRLRGQALIVFDDVQGGDREAEIRLHWLVADLPLADVPDADLAFTLPDGSTWALRVWGGSCQRRDQVRARGDLPRGLWSPNYAEMAPAWSLAVTASGSGADFLTWVGPAGDLAAFAASLAAAEPDGAETDAS
ncbi:alginate lyase family protein [bacterium]|nr:alginate lyase family protein [bacterium]